MKFVKIFLLSFALLFVMVPLYSTQAGIVPCGNNVVGTAEGDACKICDLSQGIWNIIDFFKNIMAVAAVVVIVVAGIIYISSAGNQQVTTMAKSAIKNALIGLIVMLTAFLIITFLLNAVFNIGGSEGQVAEAGGLENYRFGRMWTFTCPTN